MKNTFATCHSEGAFRHSSTKAPRPKNPQNDNHPFQRSLVWGMRSVVSGVAFAALLFLAGCTKSDNADQKSSDTVQQHQHDGEKAEEYYTCPMHPSVRSDRPGACPVCGMALVKKSAMNNNDTSGVGSLKSVSLSPTQRVIANVSVIQAQRKEISRDIQAVGIVSYSEPNYQRISMRFPGRLEKLYLSYTGQSVRKGDRVAEVYSPEAISAQQEYLLALDSHEQAEAGAQTFAESAAQLLEQSKQKLLQWGFTEKQIATLRETRAVSNLVTIYSHVSGTVVKKSVDLQQYTSTGEALYDVADLSTVWTYLDVYEKDIRFVTPGQSVLLKTEAYPSEKFAGRVVFVDPVVNPETRTVRVRTEFPNRHFKLKPNRFVTATIAVPKARALAVPSTAIMSTGKRTVVWVEVKENTFEPRDVVVGSTSNGSTAILNGLDEGEHVVETGGFLLDSESALQQPTAADPHAGHKSSSATTNASDVEQNTSSSMEDHSAHSGTQEVSIRVKDGYSPNVIRVKAGVPVKLVFNREENSRCSEELVIEKFGIRRKLAAFATTAIEFTPKESGEIPFSCGMKMLHGKIIVE
ncbi:MAG: efflux RND transporter periplasmic adaptor subunit [Ignavibacteriae bacterium]|nr:efflux RND transporter periplasmic adaptor subunit [Ignavibacteriota bacterium]